MEIYDKKIRYLDYLERGNKIRNGGFAKIEVHGRECRVQINIRGLYPTDTLQGEICIHSSGKEIKADTIMLHFGTGTYAAIWDMANIANCGVDYENWDGLSVRLSEHRIIKNIWKQYTPPTQQREPADGKEKNNARQADSIIAPAAGTQTGSEITDGAVPPQMMEISSGIEKTEKKMPEQTGEKVSEQTKESPVWQEEESGTQDTQQNIGIINREDTGSEPGTAYRERIELERKIENREEAKQETGIASRERTEPESGIASQERTELEGGIASRERIEPESGIASQERIEPEGGIASRERMEPEGGIASRERTEPEGGIASQGNTESGSKITSITSREGKETENGTASREGKETGGEITYQTVEIPAEHEEDRLPVQQPFHENSSTEQAAQGYARKIAMHSPWQLRKPEIISPNPSIPEVKEKDSCSRGGAAADRQKEAGSVGEIPKQPAKPLYDDKWKQLRQIYKTVYPFGDERNYLSIAPRDFIILPQKYQGLVSNSFLLHGYYNYGHVLLGRQEKRGESIYYLGVPGIYHDREKQVALMFGFEAFEGAAEPCAPGSFGYYMFRVEI